MIAWEEARLGPAGGTDPWRRGPRRAGGGGLRMEKEETADKENEGAAQERGRGREKGNQEWVYDKVMEEESRLRQRERKT